MERVQQVESTGFMYGLQTAERDGKRISPACKDSGWHISDASFKKKIACLNE